MVETKKNETFKLDLDRINKCIDKAIKPDSVKNIMNRFGLKFPVTLTIAKNLYCVDTGELTFNAGDQVEIIRDQDSEYGAAIHLESEKWTLVSTTSKKFFPIF